MYQRGILLICAGVLAGCGSSGSENADAVRVSGVVTLDNKPLVGADVVFSNGKFSSFGKTGSDGRYTLAQGALPGENKVSISKWEGGEIQDDPESGMDAGQMEAGAMALENDPNQRGGSAAALNMPRQLVPAQFNKDGKLTYPVPDDGTDKADFNLTSG